MQIRRDEFSVREADRSAPGVRSRRHPYSGKQPGESKIQYRIWKTAFIWNGR